MVATTSSPTEASRVSPKNPEMPGTSCAPGGPPVRRTTPAVHRPNHYGRSTMLPRGTEYVLTWDDRSHSWIAQPLVRDCEHIISVGPETIHIAPAVLDAVSPVGWDA